MDATSHCQRCGSSFGIGWVRWLPGITSAIFALLMAAFLLHYAIPASRKGRPDTTTEIAIHMTSTLFICGSATVGAILGWVVARLIKFAAKR
jgi:hypothetical protein